MRRLTRRQFLQSAVGTVGVVSLAGCVAPRSTRRVVIVGAGIAGLTAAWMAERAGLEGLTVYEGRGRVGGRMHTGTMPDGSRFEHGGQLINADHGRLIAQAETLELKLYSAYPDSQAGPTTGLHIDGQRRTEIEFIRAAEPLAKRMRRDQAQPPADLGRISVADYLERIEIEPWALRTVRLAVTQEYGLDPEELSAEAFVQYSGYESIGKDHPRLYEDGYGKFVVEGGSDRIPNAIAARLKAEIRLEKQLVALRQGAQAYELDFDDGSTVRAEYVILALPFSVLRNVRLDRAGFSESALKTIRRLRYGTNEKILVNYQRDPRTVGPEHQETMSTGLEASLWLDNVYDPEMVGRNLVLYRGGAAGLRASTDAKTPERLLPELERVFPGSTPRFRGTMVSTRWNDSNDPFSAGSYACLTPDTNDLEFSTREGDVFFAGEHLDDAFSGYMEGAIRSGEASAQALIKAVS